MPAFCARWPNGSFSIVVADDEVHALIQLDELGDEPAELWQMESCLLDFELTDQGTFRLSDFGEETGPEIVDRAYPVLCTALKDDRFEDHSIVDTGETHGTNDQKADETLLRAVENERNRLENFRRSAAATEAGKVVQSRIGGSGTYIDAIVEQAAARQLKRYKAPRTAKPS